MNGPDFLASLALHGETIAVTLTLAAIVGLILKVRSQAATLRDNTRRMEDLQQAVAAYGQTLIASRTLLERMESRVSEFTDRNLEIQSQFAFNRSFEEAARLVKDGGTVESLVSGCGLSDAEAALMVRMHQRDQQKPRQQWRAPELKSAGDDQIRVQAEPEESALTTEEIRLQESIRAAQSSR